MDKFNTRSGADYAKLYIQCNNDFDKEQALLQEQVQMEYKYRQLYATERDSQLLNTLPDASLVDVFQCRDSFNRTQGETDCPVPRLFKRKKALSAGYSVVTQEQFVRNFNLFTENQLRDIDWTNVLVAGGAVLACLQPIPQEHDKDNFSRRKYLHSEYSSSDVDIFLYNVPENEANGRLIKLANEIRDSIPYPSILVRSSHAVTLVSQYPFRHIQIVLRLYKSPAEVLMGFDVDCAAVGYNGTSVFAVPRAHMAIVKGRNTVDLTRRSPTYEPRLAKYSARNFEVLVPGLRINRVDPMIYEKPYDKLYGLSKLLMLEKFATPEARQQYRNSQMQKRLRPTEVLSGVLNRPSTFGGDEFMRERNDAAGKGHTSDYSAVFLPWSDKWPASRIRKLMLQKDYVLNHPWWKVKSPCHFHPCFITYNTAEIIKDMCGACPPTTLELASQEDVDFPFVTGPLKWMTVNPGRQTIGSFHPITDGEWSEGAYLPDNVDAVISCACNGTVNEVEKLLSDPKVDVNVHDHTGRTPIHLAVLCNNIPVVDVLVKHGARINARMKDGRTILHIAASRGYGDMLTHILGIIACKKSDQAKEEDAEEDAEDAEDDEEAGSDVDNNMAKHVKDHLKTVRGESKDAEDILDIESREYDIGLTPLHCAVFYGHIDCVRALLDAGAQVDALVQCKVVNQKTPQFTIPIIQLCSAHESWDIAELLIETSKKIARPMIPLVDQLDLKSKSPLYHAADENNFEFAKFLIGHGAKVAGNSTSNSPIFAAVSSCHHDIAMYLLERNGPNLDPVNIVTAAEKFDFDFIRRALELYYDETKAAVVRERNKQSKQNTSTKTRRKLGGGGGSDATYRDDEGNFVLDPNNVPFSYNAGHLLDVIINSVGEFWRRTSTHRQTVARIQGANDLVKKLESLSATEHNTYRFTSVMISLKAKLDDLNRTREQEIQEIDRLAKNSLLSSKINDKTGEDWLLAALDITSKFVDDLQKRFGATWGDVAEIVNIFDPVHAAKLNAGVNTTSTAVPSFGFGSAFGGVSKTPGKARAQEAYNNHYNALNNVANEFTMKLFDEFEKDFSEAISRDHAKAPDLRSCSDVQRSKYEARLAARNEAWARRCLVLYENVYAGNCKAVIEEANQQHPLHIPSITHKGTGDSLLHVAVARGHVDCVRALIQLSLKMYVPFKKEEVELVGDPRLARLNNFDFAAIMRSGVSGAGLINQLMHEEKADKEFKDPNQLILEKMQQSPNQKSIPDPEVSEPPLHVYVDALVLSENKRTRKLPIDIAVENHNLAIISALFEECVKIPLLLDKIHPGKEVYGSSLRNSGPAVESHDDDDDEECSDECSDDGSEQSEKRTKHDDVQINSYNGGDVICFVTESKVDARMRMQPMNLAESLALAVTVSDKLISDDSIDTIKLLLGYNFGPFKESLARVNVEEIVRLEKAKKTPEWVSDFVYNFGNSNTLQHNDPILDPIQWAAALNQPKLMDWLLSNECKQILADQTKIYNEKAALLNERLIKEHEQVLQEANPDVRKRCPAPHIPTVCDAEFRMDMFTWYNPLLEAINCNQLEMVKKILADSLGKTLINVTDRNGRTPLAVACATQSKGCGTVKVLMDHGADPSVLDDNLCNAVHEAARNGNHKAIEYMMPRLTVSIVNAKSKLGATPLSLGLSYPLVVSVLIRAGASPSLADDELELPVHQVVAKGNTASLQYMLETSTPVEENAVGDTPYDVALKILATTDLHDHEGYHQIPASKEPKYDEKELNKTIEQALDDLEHNKAAQPIQASSLATIARRSCLRMLQDNLKSHYTSRVPVRSDALAGRRMEHEQIKRFGTPRESSWLDRRSKYNGCHDSSFMTKRHARF